MAGGSNEADEINKILEQIGVTAENVRRRRRNAILFEFSIGYPTESGYQLVYPHLCGSIADGLVSPCDQTSDLDFQWIYPVNIIDSNTSFCDLPYQFINKAIFSIEDSLTHPLFKRLRYISGQITGDELRMSDQYAYLSHLKFREGILLEFSNLSESTSYLISENLTQNMFKQQPQEVVDTSVGVSGPAVNISLTTANTFSLRMGCQIDSLIAIRCFVWPDDTKEWFIRRRGFNWPTSEIINKIKDAGCTFVSKGFDESEQYDIEWRIAFTIAERILISTFNDTQRKCYVLLKFLHKKYIKVHFPDTVSSYHLKTVMFWVCEETCHSEFRRDRIVECFFMCIDRLVAYLLQCHCPLYFNKSVNLFYKIAPETCDQIVMYLEDIKENIFPKFIHMIGIESVQYNFSFVRADKIIYELSKGFIVLLKLNDFIKGVYNLSTYMLQNACMDTFLKQIEVNIFVLNHNVSTTDQYLCNVKADLLSIAISALCEVPLSNKKQYQLLKTYSSLLPSCLVAEGFPAILKRATICYKFGQYSECLYLTLNIIERLLDDDVIYIPSHLDILSTQGLKIGINCVCPSNKTKDVCCNVSFSPMEKSVVPLLVRQEMEIPKTYDKKSWLGWAFIDSIIYAYFLAIMCQHEVSEYTTRNGLILDMEDVFNRKLDDLFYPETALRFLQHCKAL